jgi:hypothetical protein
VPHLARLRAGLGTLGYAEKVMIGDRVDEAVSKNPDSLVELFEKEASDMPEKAAPSY